VADTIHVLVGERLAQLARVKADVLDGPWCVTPDPSGDGFNATHTPTGLGAAGHMDAHKARAVADALNRDARVRSLQDLVRLRFVIDAIAGATIEGVRA